VIITEDSAVKASLITAELMITGRLQVMITDGQF
jgi:hypothetical protein